MNIVLLESVKSTLHQTIVASDGISAETEINPTLPEVKPDLTLL